MATRGSTTRRQLASRICTARHLSAAQHCIVIVARGRGVQGSIASDVDRHRCRRLRSLGRPLPLHAGELHSAAGREQKSIATWANAPASSGMCRSTRSALRVARHPLRKGRPVHISRFLSPAGGLRAAAATSRGRGFREVSRQRHCPDRLAPLRGSGGRRPARLGRLAVRSLRAAALAGAVAHPLARGVVVGALSDLSAFCGLQAAATAHTGGAVLRGSAVVATSMARLVMCTATRKARPVLSFGMAHAPSRSRGHGPSPAQEFARHRGVSCEAHDLTPLTALYISVWGVCWAQRFRGVVPGVLPSAAHASQTHFVVVRWRAKAQPRGAV